jgi:hypothetical protein
LWQVINDLNLEQMYDARGRLDFQPARSSAVLLAAAAISTSDSPLAIT